METERRPTIHYERHELAIKLTLVGLTNHELREVLVGLWARLDPANRADHIRELIHYHTDPRSWFSPLADAVRTLGPGDKSVDQLIRQEFRSDGPE